MLTRPRDVSVDIQGRSKTLTRFLESLGATVPVFPASEKCCGSYQIVENPQAAVDAVSTILNEAVKSGAEVLALTCPLCDFNIRRAQEQLMKENRIPKEIPVFYFTQLSAIALGLTAEHALSGLSDTALSLVRRLSSV
jgi:heterodisulfide reductase subunit B